jgi:two-component system chemotaxis response regulator CheB
VTARDLIRVLVIDDSAASRRAIQRILDASPWVEVVGTAHDGEEALRKTRELEPDVITLDLEMPRMDGFTFLRLVMTQRPTPVVVISGRTGSEDVFKALELGAVDFIAKPAPGAAAFEALERDLIQKVHALRELPVPWLREAGAPPPQPCAVPGEARALVAIGASTGGPSALMQIFAGFSAAPHSAFLVCQHMPEGFTRGFAARLDRLTALRAREARGGERPEPGLVLIAPGGSHLELDAAGGRIVTRVSPPRPEDRYVPSVDRLFESAAKHAGADLLAIVLTGMGDDGCRGARAVRAGGGTVIAESQESAVIFGMPQQVIRAGLADAVLHRAEMGAAIASPLPRGRSGALSGG